MVSRVRERTRSGIQTAKLLERLLRKIPGLRVVNCHVCQRLLAGDRNIPGDVSRSGLEKTRWIYKRHPVSMEISRRPICKECLHLKETNFFRCDTDVGDGLNFL